MSSKSVKNAAEQKFRFAELEYNLELERIKVQELEKKIKKLEKKLKRKKENKKENEEIIEETNQQLRKSSRKSKQTEYYKDVQDKYSTNEYHGWIDQWDREYDGRKPESNYSGYYEDGFVVNDDECEESDYEPDEDVSECNSDSEYE